MAVRVQNFPKKNISQPFIQPMSHFPFITTAWWNSQEEQFHQPLSKSLSLKVGSPRQACHAEKHAGRQPQDQDSSSTQSTYQSHQEVVALGGNSFQDQCISSDSGLMPYVFNVNQICKLQIIVTCGMKFSFIFKIFNVSSFLMICYDYILELKYASGFTRPNPYCLCLRSCLLH